MRSDAGLTRSVALEFIPSPAGLAWRKVVFAPGEPAGSGPAGVPPSGAAPRAPARVEPGLGDRPPPDAQRSCANSTAEGARGIAAANPSLSLREPSTPPPRSFGDFSVQCLFAARDATTGALGLCASVSNHTARRLLFDPSSWVVRAGDRVYPVRTVDFAGEIEPGGSQAAFLVLARGPDGRPTRLPADDEFEASVVLKPGPRTRAR